MPLKVLKCFTQEIHSLKHGIEGNWKYPMLNILQTFPNLFQIYFYKIGHLQFACLRNYLNIDLACGSSISLQ
jgi:hypothetical protein